MHGGERSLVVLMRTVEYEFLISEAERTCRSKSAHLRYLLMEEMRRAMAESVEAKP